MVERVVLGLTEQVILEGKQIIARIDSGATTSSIDESLANSLNLQTTDKVKKVKSASGTTHRPTVVANVEIQGKTHQALFTLADRTHLKYPALIGQNILKNGNFLIDPLKEAPK